MFTSCCPVLVMLLLNVQESLKSWNSNNCKFLENYFFYKKPEMISWNDHACSPNRINLNKSSTAYLKAYAYFKMAWLAKIKIVSSNEVV